MKSAVVRALEPSPSSSWRPRAGPRGTSRSLPDPTPTATGTFLRYPSLARALPPLVTIQRRLAALIAAVAQDVKDEKMVRGEIDALLIVAGLGKNEVVTCAGYDVKHNVKAGSTSVNLVKLTEQLVAAGIDRDFLTEAVKECTETGESAKFATVSPSKGATVQPPEKLRMAKATVKRKRG